MWKGQVTTNLILRKIKEVFSTLSSLSYISYNFSAETTSLPSMPAFSSIFYAIVGFFGSAPISLSLEIGYSCTSALLWLLGCCCCLLGYLKH